MDLHQASRLVREHAQEAKANQMRIQTLANEALQRAIDRSSGAFSLSSLANQPLNHPYGIGSEDYRGRPRGAVPYGDYAMVNEQSGDFKRAWRVIIQPNGFILMNDSDHAKAIEDGTKKMVGRPILEAVVGEVIEPYARKQKVNYRINIS